MTVNSEMLRFYWSIGHDMDEKKNLYHWGSNFYEQVGKDLLQAVVFNADILHLLLQLHECAWLESPPLVQHPHVILE